VIRVVELQTQGVASKGWLTNFEVAYSSDGSTWNTIKAGANAKVSYIRT